MDLIHVVGSDGFIGRHLQAQASLRRVSLHSWSHRSKSDGNYFDLLNTSTWGNLLHARPKTIILLSWPGLPNYNKTFHLTRNLPACVELLEALVACGLRTIVITGTCYEYGLSEGSLAESVPTNPVNYYAIAKDSLRRAAQYVSSARDLQLCWLRIFYPYGPGQNKRSLYPTLMNAIMGGKQFFEMSQGHLIRDFLKVEIVASHILSLALSSTANGIYNIGSGEPCSVLDFADRLVRKYDSQLVLKPGRIPVRDDEPKAFWADMTRFNSEFQ